MNIRSMCRWLSTGLVSSLVVFPAYAQSPGDHPHTWHGGGDWGHMLFGPLMMLLFLGAVVLAIVFAVRSMGGSTPGYEPPATPNRPLATLEERFARGEIDKDEFEERKRLLSS